MIDSIYTAMTGLDGHQRALKIISNNVANMNTAGFRASTIDFADVLVAGDPSGQQNMTGGGLNAEHVRLDLRAGSLQSTGRDTDLAIDGAAFFVLQTESGEQRFTRSGNFDFDDDGALIGGTSGLQVMARDANGALSKFEFDKARTNPPKATGRVVLKGNISTGDSDGQVTIDSLTVYDAAGGSHTLTLTFTTDPLSVAEVRWNVTIAEGLSTLGTGDFSFSLPGTPSLDGSSFKVMLALQGAPATEVEFALGADATSHSGGTQSDIALDEQDGYAAGRVSTMTFDEKGQLKITYSNGQKEDGPTLAFAEFDGEQELLPAGESLLQTAAGASPTFRAAGDGLKVVSGNLELSNVDLTQEFSTLILMQRGYQASSQVLTTANEMLQQLFELKGRR
jgi:flagellar hook protein FlgE